MREIDRLAAEAMSKATDMIGMSTEDWLRAQLAAAEQERDDWCQRFQERDKALFDLTTFNERVITERDEWKELELDSRGHVMRLRDERDELLRSRGLVAAAVEAQVREACSDDLTEARAACERLNYLVESALRALSDEELTPPSRMVMARVILRAEKVKLQALASPDAEGGE